MNERDQPGEVAIEQWRRTSAGVLRTNARIIERVEQAGVHESWFEVLNLLLRASDHRLPMSRLAREVMMSSGGFTKLADRMAREGLIDRRGSSADRRVVYAALTPAGIELAERVSGVFRDALNELVLSVIGPDGLGALADTLGSLAERHSDHVETNDDDTTVLTARDPALPDRRGRGRETT